MKTVRIYGMAPNLVEAPPVPMSTDVWCCNNPRRAYRKYRPQALQEWTRWFNLHSLRHMQTAYPRGYAWFAEQATGKPIMLQASQPDVPDSQAFPRDAVMAHFGTRYFTFTGAWQIALALYEHFERIELYGFRMSTRKPMYARERPCFFHWVNVARALGCDLRYPADVGTGDAGDAAAYTGPLYGYETS